VSFAASANSTPLTNDSAEPEIVLEGTDVDRGAAQLRFPALSAKWRAARPPPPRAATPRVCARVRLQPAEWSSELQIGQVGDQVGRARLTIDALRWNVLLRLRCPPAFMVATTHQEVSFLPIAQAAARHNQLARHFTTLHAERWSKAVRRVPGSGIRTRAERELGRGALPGRPVEQVESVEVHPSRCTSWRSESQGRTTSRQIAKYGTIRPTARSKYL
jgi:hypothetical protein